MKKIIFIISSLFLLNSCTKDFEEINTNPLDLTSANPEDLLPKAIYTGYSASYEYYYDFYRKIMPWTQSLVPSSGNSVEFMESGDNMNQRWDVFYEDYGGLLTEIMYKIDHMPASQQSRYVNVRSIASILKAYYAWYVTDVSGNMPYTEAFQARTGGTLTPVYETQEQLYEILDNQINKAYTDIEGADQSIQVNPGSKDLFFGGNITKWKKVANSLRLKMATRLMKRNPSKLRAIAAEVLTREQLSSTSDDFTLVGKRITEHGNFYPGGLSASKPMVDYMVTNSDPRLPLFFLKNDYSEEAIKLLAKSNLMKLTPETQRYVGGPTSPDMVSAKKSRYYTDARRTLSGKSYDTVSRIQPRIWQAEFEGGTGLASIPILTYAEYTLLKAELAARGYISGDVQSLYEAGVKASIATYNSMAKNASVIDYSETKDEDITNYLQATNVKYNSSNALEQIIIQEYLNYFKQPNEIWSLIKRTGLPNTSTALKLENLTRDGGIQLTMPRRVPLATPSRDNLNYKNQYESLQKMKNIPGFGKSDSDIQGRIWWDMQ